MNGDDYLRMAINSFTFDMNPPPFLVAFLFLWVLAGFVFAFKLQIEANRQNRSMISWMIWSMLLWPVVMPLYFLMTRRLRGFLGAGFVGFMVLACAGGALLSQKYRNGMSDQELSLGNQALVQLGIGGAEPAKFVYRSEPLKLTDEQHALAAKALEHFAASIQLYPYAYPAYEGLYYSSYLLRDAKTLASYRELNGRMKAGRADAAAEVRALFTYTFCDFFLQGIRGKDRFQYGDAASYLASLQKQVGVYDDAQSGYKRFQALPPSPAGSPEKPDKAELQEIQAYYQNLTTTLDPLVGTPRALTLKRQESKDWADAITCYVQGLYQIDHSDCNAAERLFLSASRLEPNYGNPYIYRAYAQYKLDRNQEVCGTASKGIGLLQAQGSFGIRSPNSELAAGHAACGLALARDWQDILNRRASGTRASAKKKYAQALGELNLAASLDPDHPLVGQLKTQLAGNNQTGS